MTLSTRIETQPVVSRFFGDALRSRSLAHAYILKGHHYDEMYQMALDLARALNCRESESPEQACGQCQNCRWIERNAHPAVITISRLTYLVSARGQDLSEDELNKLSKKNPQTQIKADQIERLLQQLGLSSEHTRVIIFTDAEELPAGMPSGVTPPYEWQNIDANEDKSFHIRPLERWLFNAASANRFLKTLEEPPPRTVFFFIADTEESLLETIVSRCQVIPFARHDEGGQGLLPDHQAFLDRLMPQLSPQSDFYAVADAFSAYFMDDEGMTPPQALTIFQQYLHDRFRQQVVTPQSFAHYRALQEHLETALRMLSAKTNQEQTLNHLFYRLSNPVGS